MELVATLIAAPGERLGDRDIAAVRQAFEEAGGCTFPPVWLDGTGACDIALDGIARDAARDIVRGRLAEAPFDVVVQPAGNRRKRLLIADMDATIVTSETLDELAAHAGLKEPVARITARAMRGEIDFKSALRERVAMLRGLPEDTLAKTLAATALTPGARTLVRTMRANGAWTVLVSGGFRYFTRHVAALAGFDAEHGNQLEIRNGVLTGRVVEPILDREAKLQALRDHAGERDIPLEETLATGDGANDLPMILAAGLGIAFRAKPAVVKAAPAVIRRADLTALLYLQGYRRADFQD